MERKKAEEERRQPSGSKRRTVTNEDDNTVKKDKEKAIEREETKKGLSLWRDRNTVSLEKKREAARLELEQVKNTAGLNDNMDAMRDFNLISSGSLESSDSLPSRE